MQLRKASSSSSVWTETTSKNGLETSQTLWNWAQLLHREALTYLWEAPQDWGCFASRAWYWSGNLLWEQRRDGGTTSVSGMKRALRSGLSWRVWPQLAAKQGWAAGCCFKFWEFWQEMLPERSPQLGVCCWIEPLRGLQACWQKQSTAKLLNSRSFWSNSLPTAEGEVMCEFQCGSEESVGRELLSSTPAALPIAYKVTSGC